MRRIAECLIDYEASGTAATANPAGFRVIERLRPQLAMLMGTGGFRALLARALNLAGAEVAWLRTVRANAEGILEGLAAPYASLTPAEFREGRVALLAQLLGLLVSFIGPGLTARLVADIWPQLPADNLDFGNGGKE